MHPARPILGMHAGPLARPTQDPTHRPLSSSFVYGLYLESYKVIPKRNYLGANLYTLMLVCVCKSVTCTTLLSRLRWRCLSLTG